ncbi:acyl-CoA dehydrogenase family protein [Streptomyces sp. B-S-A8]|uniref:Acyl-CoA dehydrogenase family protein n=1 Tax=Streptomyces solicavernae TaxID=3043614 RepID=A0ABT6RYQ0_9ACTN|nr:acyl-CoA dehydrogenase family protein [Streptomyces sp. B-S-A8]MDI3389570.1 acyl-CoA dehydrogenase family protein [Streptomyces sp. B-S-A8]
MSYQSALSHVLSSTIEPSAQLIAAHERFPRASVVALGEAGLLGLTVSVHFGGGGLGLAEAAEVVTAVSRACPAAGAVLRSHYAAVACIEAYGTPWLRQKVATGCHLSTLAVADAWNSDPAGGAASPAGSTALRTGDVVTLRARKCDVVAAGEADSYIWSSPPVDDGGSALWVISADAPGLFVPARPNGTGPRGSSTSTVCADPVRVPASARLGQESSEGTEMLHTALQWLAALPVAGSVTPGQVGGEVLT